MCTSGMLTKIAILSLIMLTQNILIKTWAKLINFREDFLWRSQAQWVIFREVLRYYFHESTSLTILTKIDLSRTGKRKSFPYFLEV